MLPARAPGRIRLHATWEYDPDDPRLRDLLARAEAYHAKLGLPPAEFRADVLVREDLTIDTTPATLQSERITRLRRFEMRYGDGRVEPHTEEVEYRFHWIDPNSWGTVGSGHYGDEASDR
jgi:hypothetical protein